MFLSTRCLSLAHPHSLQGHVSFFADWACLVISLAGLQATWFRVWDFSFRLWGLGFKLKGGGKPPFLKP